MIRKYRLPLILSVLAAAVLTAFLVPKSFGTAKKNQSYETADIERGDLSEKVSSTGTLKAVGTVNVLAQMTGTVEKLHVDYNDKVSKGQLLAELNTEELKISAKEAEAAVIKARAQLDKDLFVYNNNAKLFERKLISETDYVTAKTDLDESKAGLLAAEAAYEKILIKINQYAIIKAPISGIILERSVDRGQTVVSGGSTETELFTLAESLDNMEIEVDVDELDISKIFERQKAVFTVQSYPGRTFDGGVAQIRKVPTTTDKVVNYTVVVSAKNPEGILLPGMTATVDFFVSEKKNALLVPNGAFRFKPSKDVETAVRKRMLEERIKDLPEAERKEALKKFDEGQKTGTQTGTNRGLLGGMPGGPGGPPQTRQRTSQSSDQTAGAKIAETRKTLWLLDKDGNLTAKSVKVGTQDSSRTEILDASDIEGKAVVIRAK